MKEKRSCLVAKHQKDQVVVVVLLCALSMTAGARYLILQCNFLSPGKLELYYKPAISLPLFVSLLCKDIDTMSSVIGICSYDVISSISLSLISCSLSFHRNSLHIKLLLVHSFSHVCCTGKLTSSMCHFCLFAHIIQICCVYSSNVQLCKYIKSCVCFHVNYVY